MMKELDADPVRLLPILLGAGNAGNQTEIATEVLKLFDTKKSFRKQMKLLEEVGCAHT